MNAPPGTPSADPQQAQIHALAAAASTCPQCGEPVDALDEFCSSCGYHFPRKEAAPQAARQYFRCRNCGAEVATEQQQRSYVCPFCDSTYVMPFSPQQGRHEVEFVIGFAITREQAWEHFRQWLARGNWFRPSDLAQAARVAEKLRGVYIPFWSFSTLAQCEWNAQIGEYWYRTETYTTYENGKPVVRTRQVRETEWWWLSGRYHRYVSGYLVSGSRGLPQEVAERIKPFQLTALKRFQPGYLAGWMAEEYTVEEDQARQMCLDYFHQLLTDEIAEFLPGDTYRDLSVQSEFSQVNSDLILLPVYLLAYRYRGKLYRFVLNGQTGKATGDKPLSWLKIGLCAGVALAVLIIAAVIILLLQ